MLLTANKQLLAGGSRRRIAPLAAGVGRDHLQLAGILDHHGRAAARGQVDMASGGNRLCVGAVDPGDPLDRVVGLSGGRIDAGKHTGLALVEINTPGGIEG